MSGTFPGQRRSRKAQIFATIAVGVFATLAPLAMHRDIRLIWNASASVPQGLYLVRSAADLNVGDLAVMRLTEPTRTLADRRQYLPADVPLIKPVAALAGQTVCRKADEITIDGHVIAVAQSRDSLRRPLPVWGDCIVLQARHVFVINPAVPESFDGRYFGVSDKAQVIGRASGLLTFDAGRQQPGHH